MSVHAASPFAGFTIGDMWESYRRVVLAGITEPIQIQETKRAFFAACYGLLVHMRDGVSDMQDDEGVVHMEGLLQECGKFSEDVQAGRA